MEFLKYELNFFCLKKSSSFKTDIFWSDEYWEAACYWLRAFYCWIIRYGPCLVQFWIVHYARTHGSTYVVNDFICRCQSWKMILPILVVMDPTWSSTSVLQSSEIIHSMSVTTVWLGLDLSWLSYLCLSLSAPLSLSWDIFPKAVPKIRPCELWQLSL